MAAVRFPPGTQFHSSSCGCRRSPSAESSPTRCGRLACPLDSAAAEIRTPRRAIRSAYTTPDRFSAPNNPAIYPDSRSLRQTRSASLSLAPESLDSSTAVSVNRRVAPRSGCAPFPAPWPSPRAENISPRITDRAPRPGCGLSRSRSASTAAGFPSLPAAASREIQNLPSRTAPIAPVQSCPVNATADTSSNRPAALPSTGHPEP